MRPGTILTLLTAFFLAILLGVVYADNVVDAFNRLRAASPSGPDREIVIYMEDFRFSPSVIRVKAGERVRLRLINVGRHTHEFMVGKEIHVEGDVSEPPEPDFFEGIEVSFEVVQGEAMPMFGGDMEMGMGMEGMEMGGMEMGDMGDMGGMQGVVVRAGIHAEDLNRLMEDLHGGNMVMANPGSEVVLEFTVPEDKVGTWVFGCFQEDGLHFDAGMRGYLIVEP